VARICGLVRYWIGSNTPPAGEAEVAGISSACWPLFGQLWPSARTLADLMQVWAFGDRRILEIGCGLALASLLVHRRHDSVTASDCHPLAESFLCANLRLNDLPDFQYSAGHWARANPLLGRVRSHHRQRRAVRAQPPDAACSVIQIHASAQAEELIARVVVSCSGALIARQPRAWS
jgi:hypothetical protein